NSRLLYGVSLAQSRPLQVVAGAWCGQPGAVCLAPDAAPEQQCRSDLCGLWRGLYFHGPVLAGGRWTATSRPVGSTRGAGVSHRHGHHYAWTTGLLNRCRLLRPQWPPARLIEQHFPPQVDIRQFLACEGPVSAAYARFDHLADEQGVVSSRMCGDQTAIERG